MNITIARIRLIGATVAATGVILLALFSWLLPGITLYHATILAFTVLIIITGLLIYSFGREIGKPIDWLLLPNSGKRPGDYYMVIAIPARCEVAILREYRNGKFKREWMVRDCPLSLASYLQGRFKKIDNTTTERA